EQFGGENTILGYECDGCHFEIKDGRPVPTCDDGTPENFQILAQGPAKWSGMEQDVFVEAGFQEDGGSACLGIYERNGTVLTVGSTDWAHGLGNDPIVDRITLNIIERLK
ncbi:MAG: hypothetical protein HRT89_22660, partial [Lentisphaeria bacterium]|nr:hypothetical protein [Lentisphaeria bacterium]NQZ70862.1 hypothetical protein [Lentisphaeria bacterium]